MMILNLSESLAKPHDMAKLIMAYLSSLKNQKNCCRTHCRCHHLGYSVLQAHHCTIWCRSSSEPCGPDLSNSTSFLRPALEMMVTNNRWQCQRQTKCPPPEPGDILKRFYALHDNKWRYYMKKVSKLYCLFLLILFSSNCEDPLALKLEIPCHPSEGVHLSAYD